MSSRYSGRQNSRACADEDSVTEGYVGDCIPKGSQELYNDEYQRRT